MPIDNISGEIDEPPWNDHEIRLAELALKREELQTKLNFQKYEIKRSVSPLMLAIVAALSGIVGSTSGALLDFFTEHKKLELEERNLQLSIILKSVSEQDPLLTLNNLLFFVNTGILNDPDDKIAEAIGYHLEHGGGPNIVSTDGK